MQTSTNKKQSDILNTQENAENPGKENSSLIEREQVPKTPFWVINQNEKWFLIMGENRITDLFNTKEEALDELKNNQWFITISIAAIVLEKMLAQQKFLKKENIKIPTINTLRTNKTK